MAPAPPPKSERRVVPPPPPKPQRTRSSSVLSVASSSASESKGLKPPATPTTPVRLSEYSMGPDGDLGSPGGHRAPEADWAEGAVDPGRVGVIYNHEEQYSGCVIRRLNQKVSGGQHSKEIPNNTAAYCYQQGMERGGSTKRTWVIVPKYDLSGWVATVNIRWPEFPPADDEPPLQRHEITDSKLHDLLYRQGYTFESRETLPSPPVPIQASCAKAPHMAEIPDRCHEALSREVWEHAPPPSSTS